MNAIGLTLDQKNFVIETIHQYFPSCEIIFFGSRLTGTHRPHSDLDLCIRASGQLPLHQWAELSNAFTESDLPFKVDLSDWYRLKPEFQEIILKTGEIR